MSQSGGWHSGGLALWQEPSNSLGPFPEGRPPGNAKGRCVACPLCELTRVVNAWHTEKEKRGGGTGTRLPNPTPARPYPQTDYPQQVDPTLLEDFRLPVTGVSKALCDLSTS